MPESHSTGEALATLWSADCWHTYADHGKKSICKAELSKKKKNSGKEIGKKKLDSSILCFAYI